MKVKRPWLLAVVPEESRLLDVPGLLSGRLDVTARTRLVVASPVLGRAVDVSLAEVEALARFPPERWVPADEAVDELGIPRDVLDGLCERELLLTDRPGARERALREADERLARSGWNRYAALYHGMGRWHERTASVVAGAGEEDSGHLVDGFAKLEELYGPPPPAFHEPERALGPGVELPRRRTGTPEGPGLDALLEARSSARSFDRSAALGLDDLGVLLAAVFGHHGGQRLASGTTVLKKGSPSGGALHPIEAYPLVRDVEGVEPGLYHYNVRRHRLDLLRSLDGEEAEETAERLLAGQSYLAAAHVVVFLTARFERNFWKYREHQKAYRVVLMDAGHLSQTFYLMCTELGLGACFTAAINDADADEALGLDGWRESAVGALACGVPAPDASGMTFRPEPLAD